MDREKVIRAVDSCFDYWLEQHRWLDPLKLENVRQFKADALTLLKEQEPRVITSNELQPDNLVWIEVPQSDEIWPALLQKIDWFNHPVWTMRGYGLGGYYLHDGYGRDWRCWTAKPTDEQRQAVKWNANS